MQTMQIRRTQSERGCDIEHWRKDAFSNEVKNFSKTFIATKVLLGTDISRKRFWPFEGLSKLTMSDLLARIDKLDFTSSRG